MENNFLSLLYPSEELAKAHVGGRSVNISEAVCEEIGLSDILGLCNSDVSDFFTSERSIIEYRQKMFEDIMNIPEISDVLGKVLPILFDIMELRRLDEDFKDANDGYLYSITEIELYVSAVGTLSEGLSEIKDKIKSEAFSRLCEKISTLSESEYYKNLNEDLKELSSRVHEVRSITLGVNLDAQLRPCEAGVISVNAEKFKSGKVLDKILRLSFKNDAFTCIAQMSPFGKGENENRREALNGAFFGAISDIFKSSVRDWRRIAGEYVLDNTDFLLKILPEIEFVTKATELMKTLNSQGYATCIPEFSEMENKDFSAKELYNPDVALQIEDEVVGNGLQLDENARIYILTGPNRGGKSVITCAMGIAQAMFQLGMKVCAESALISPVDAIFTHFPEGAEDTIDKGRLGEECARLREIFDNVSGDSMILLDESLSSTGSYEASFIASEILAGFGIVGCRGIFSTHLHELASSVDSINERSKSAGGIMIDTLVAGIEEGKRSFKIYRAKPDGKSYARDIADKYGLSFEEIKEKIGK